MTEPGGTIVTLGEGCTTIGAGWVTTRVCCGGVAVLTVQPPRASIATVSEAAVIAVARPVMA